MRSDVPERMSLPDGTCHIPLDDERPSHSQHLLGSALLKYLLNRSMSDADALKKAIFRLSFNVCVTQSVTLKFQEKYRHCTRGYPKGV